RIVLSSSEYAKVERLLGNGRLEAYCFDGVKRLCHIRGKLRKKVWISNGDIILVGLRSYQDQKADVIMKYQNDEARTLKSLGEIPDTVKLEENNDIQFDANAALLEEDGEEGSASGSDDDEDESGSNDGDSDDSDDVEESIQRYRYDYGGGKDMRSNRRK
ncbi:translation initiation factor 1A, partial [Paragonimus westermani]